MAGPFFFARDADAAEHPALQEPPVEGWDAGPPLGAGWREVPGPAPEPGEEGVVRFVFSVTGAGEVAARFERQEGERFWGFGVRSDEVERTGGVVENWAGEGPYQLGEYPLVEAITPRWAIRRRRDAAYYPVPWLISSAGYGVLVDSPELSRFRLTDEIPGCWSVEVLSERLVLRLFEGPATADVLRRFTAATGRQPFPAAAWFLGPWVQSGHADLVPYETEAAIVRRMQEADAPLSAVETHMRRLPGGAHEGRREDEKRRTDLFHRHGLASLTYLNPLVSQDYAARFDSAAPLLQRRADGSPYLYPAYIGGREPPLTIEGQLDFSRPGAAELFAELAREAVEDGHDGWMEDFGEYTPPDALCGEGEPGTAAHNRYPALFHAAGAAAAAGAGRPIARFARSGWTGAAPHLPLAWGGDPTTGWGFDGLASAVVEGLSAGLSGVALWGSDIGGFFSLGEERLDVELLVRWIQFGALSPLMRTKSEGVSIPPQPRPQVWDEAVLPHWRRWAKLHTQLSPYLLGAAAQYVESGVPLMRHLGFEDQYLLGDWLLVAPVLEPGAVERRLELPEGQWIDLWRTLGYDTAGGGLSLGSVRVLAGPDAITVPAPLAEIPLLARRGAVLPLLPPDVWSLAAPGDEARLHLLAFPDGPSATRFGRDGMLISNLDEAWRLAIDSDQYHEIQLQASLPFVPRRLEVAGGRLRDWSHDAATGVLRAALDGRRAILLATP